MNTAPEPLREVVYRELRTELVNGIPRYIYDGFPVYTTPVMPRDDTETDTIVAYFGAPRLGCKLGEVRGGNLGAERGEAASSAYLGLESGLVRSVHLAASAPFSAAARALGVVEGVERH